jgi:hypothetical protein
LNMISLRGSLAVGLAVGLVYLGWVLPALAHSWYSSTSDPETGLGCCGGQDCKPVPDAAVKIDRENGGWRYLPTGELIPWSRVQQSHDFQFHRCEYLYTITNSKGSYQKGDTRCFFVPGGTM